MFYALKKNEPVIRSNCFLKYLFGGIFSLTHKEEKVWQDETDPMSCLCMQGFISVALSKFSCKNTIFGFLIEKGL